MKKTNFATICHLTFILFSLLFTLSTTSTAYAMKIQLQWDASASNPDGYRVFHRVAGNSYDYDNPSWEGSKTTCSITGLSKTIDHYFVVRAYDGSLESHNSNEAQYEAPSSEDSSDSTPPVWSGATSGIGLAEDNGTGGSVSVEFGTAEDKVDNTDLNFNVYYAKTKNWNNNNWLKNNVVSDVTVSGGTTFTNKATINGLTNNVSYKFGIRVEDQSGNEDTNTQTMKATPTVQESSDTFCLMMSTNSNRSGANYLDDQSADGDIYVFVSPSTNIYWVKFSIDGKKKWLDRAAPFDLEGGTDREADPFDASSLSSGYHTITAMIRTCDGDTETISATLHVYSSESGSSGSDESGSDSPSDSDYNQWLSYSADRSNKAALDGSTVSGDIYVFVSPSTNIYWVKFSIDGKKKWLDRAAPFDLEGGTDREADPFDVSSLSSGYHTITAMIRTCDGDTETISSEIYVTNSSSGSDESGSDSPSDSDYNQWLSYSADRSNKAALDGSTVSGDIYVFVSPSTNIYWVKFSIDGKKKWLDRAAPFDLEGGSASQANPFDTSSLSNGSHTFTVLIKMNDGTSMTINDRVEVQN